MAHYSGLTVDWMTRKNATSDFNKTTTFSPCLHVIRKEGRTLVCGQAGGKVTLNIFIKEWIRRYQ